MVASELVEQAGLVGSLHGGRFPLLPPDVPGALDDFGGEQDESYQRDDHHNDFRHEPPEDLAHENAGDGGGDDGEQELDVDERVLHLVPKPPGSVQDELGRKRPQGRSVAQDSCFALQEVVQPLKQPQRNAEASDSGDAADAGHQDHEDHRDAVSPGEGVVQLLVQAHKVLERPVVIAVLKSVRFGADALPSAVVFRRVALTQVFAESFRHVDGAPCRGDGHAGSSYEQRPPPASV
eukprot:scaffold385_cov305-Pinguiococcus_pyrenoidosus.AAC.42